MRMGRDRHWYSFSHGCPRPFSDNVKGQNDFLEQFLGHETSYLQYLLNQELPPTDLTCTGCRDVEGRFRCLDCYGPHWWCRACLIRGHSQHPFHQPQQWKKGSFEKVSLCHLGYVFVLGHSSSGHRCPQDDNFLGDRQMTLIHVNGVFQHCVRFCQCQGAIPEHEQLFGHYLFPSSFDRPQTAFTFDVLDYYAIDAMECKTSAQSFFHKLRRVTNNAFPDELPVSSSFASNLPTVDCFFNKNRYLELIRVSRQMRKLKNLKHFGAVYEDASSAAGSLTIYCPSCPQPGVNLPPDWTTLPNWVTRRTITVDGNFHADHIKMRRPDLEIQLTNGKGFMVEESRYMEYLNVVQEPNFVSN